MCSRNVSRCTCEARVVLLDEEENKHYQFLMGLNETYVSIKGNILMMHPLPSSDPYNILVQDERQTQVTASSHFSELNSASFNFNANNKAPSDRRYIPRVNFGTNNEFLPKPTLIYKYCKNVGHLIGKCYKLHGYPHFKFTKGTKTVIHVEVHIENPLVHLSMQGHLNTVPTLDLSFLVSPRNNIHN